VRADDADAGAIEQQTARDWAVETMGEVAWEAVWGPLVTARFGPRADEISAAWLWGELRRRTEPKQGYPHSSFAGLHHALVEQIEANGSVVHVDHPVQRIARREPGGFWVWPGAPGSFRHGRDPREFPVEVAQPEHFDAVLATVPGDVFERMLDTDLLASFTPGYVSTLRAIEYRAVTCLVLEVGRPVPSDPLAGLVEHVAGGRRFLYVVKWLEPGEEPPPAGLEDGTIVQSWEFFEPAAQPVLTLGYEHRIPPLDTGVPGLVLANTTQIYPEGGGLNYAVELGEQAALALADDPSAY
jgi:hypothetical protein